MSFKLEIKNTIATTLGGSNTLPTRFRLVVSVLSHKHSHIQAFKRANDFNRVNACSCHAIPLLDLSTSFYSKADSILLLFFCLFSAFYFISCNYLAFSRRLFQWSSVFVLSLTLFPLSVRFMWRKCRSTEEEKITKKYQIDEYLVAECCLQHI